MDIKMPLEFDAVLESYLEPVTKELKQLELTRRFVSASAARTEKERKRIMEYSTAFMYKIHIIGGIVSLEREPPGEEDKLINDITIETQTMINTILPEKIHVAMDAAKPELIELIRPQVIELIRQTLGGVSQ